MLKRRCAWVSKDPLYIAYHDKEWGRPVRADKKIFEFLVLESAQAGLSWLTILRKRENYRKAFDGFDPRKVARFDARDVKRLLANSGIIRNRLKIEAAINNAKRFLEIQKEFGTFSRYMWQFVPASEKKAEQFSKDLKHRGFKFLGPTVCYAHMQAVGMVNDHSPQCFLHQSRKKQLHAKINS